MNPFQITVRTWFRVMRGQQWRNTYPDAPQWRYAEKASTLPADVDYLASMLCRGEMPIYHWRVGPVHTTTLEAISQEQALLLAAWGKGSTRSHRGD